MPALIADPHTLLVVVQTVETQAHSPIGVLKPEITTTGSETNIIFSE
jgi:hypothetical protein